MSGLANKLKLGHHYAIERFGVSFILLTVCMIALVSSIFMKKLESDKEQLSGQAVYTQSIVTSLTNVSGKVQGVYTNIDHTKCFVFVKFEDMGKLPIEADCYGMFLTGSTTSQRHSDLLSNPKASVYVFGSTGYWGVYLVDSAGFPSQILDLTVRSLKSLATTESVNMSMANSDESFATNDQFRIYFNPGGEYATHANFLEQDSFTLSDIYEEVITRKEEATIRQNLVNDLFLMDGQSRLIEEYTNRLESLYDMVVPAMPSQINGDRVVAVNADKKELEWNDYANAYVDPDTNQAYKEGEYVLYLETDYVAPTGYDFIWQDHMVKDGYLDELCNGQDIVTFLTNKRREKSTEADVFSTSMSWYYQNGMEFLYDSDEADSTETGIQAEIERLTAAWTAFYNAKIDYQTVQLPALLTLERNVREVQKNYTVNSENNLILW